MKEAYIVSGARTAVGEFGGSLRGVSVVEMGRLVIKEAIVRAGLKYQIGRGLRHVEGDEIGAGGCELRPALSAFHRGCKIAQSGNRRDMNSRRRIACIDL